MSKHLFLSPHLDDAILSSGEYIVELISNGEHVKVVTIFSGYPPEKEFSDAAKQFCRECGYGTELMSIRCKEDACSMTYLGCEFLHLGLLECLFRKDNEGKHIYPDLDDIYHLDMTRDSSYIDTLVEAISSEIDDADCVYSPIGIGNHADHLMTRYAVERLENREDINIYYYQDFPYVLDRNRKDLPADLSNLIELKIIPISENAIEKKISAMKFYKSQISMLFQNERKMCLDIYDYLNTCNSSGYHFMLFGT